MQMISLGESGAPLEDGEHVVDEEERRVVRGFFRIFWGQYACFLRATGQHVFEYVLETSAVWNVSSALFR